MSRIINREEEKKVINLLRKKQPRTFDDIKKAMSLREFDLKKLLKAMEKNEILVNESLIGVEKFWLNESMGVDFLGRSPTQKKTLKHPKKKEGFEESFDEDPAYI